MRKQAKEEPEVPYLIELHPGLVCDSEIRKYVGRNNQTKSVTPCEFAVIKVLWLADRQSQTGIGSVRTDVVIDAVFAVKSRNKKGKKFDYNHERGCLLRLTSTMNIKFRDIHFDEEIIIYNEVRDDWRLKPASLCGSDPDKKKQAD